jgi:SH3-like domain-containing protein
MKKFALVFFLYFAMTSLILAKESLPNKSGKLPYFGIIKAGETNLRNGPNVKYPIKWVIVKAKEPVEIVGEFEKWKKVRDFDGDEGWIHDSLFSSKRRAIVKKNAESKIYQKPHINSQPVALVKALVRVDLIKCQLEWCYIKAAKYKGWVSRKNLWGVYPNEDF